jgi:hypothetical protein
MLNRGFLASRFARFFAPNTTFWLDFREHAKRDSRDRMGCMPANVELSQT